MKNVFLIAGILMFVHHGRAQELNAQVRVSYPGLATSDRSVISRMEAAVKDFLNSTKWTNDVFETHERIKCNFQITLRQDNGDNNFIIDLSAMASRPVFNASYETPLLSIQEKEIPIHYDPFRNLENSKEIYIDNLSAVLTFYAYLIIFLDYESFGEESGEVHLVTLNNMLNNLPSAAKGADDNWSPTARRKNNRFYIIENLTNPRMKPFRKAFYKYHRFGLDQFYKDSNLARQEMTDALELIINADKSYPQTYLMQLFATAKSTEIMEIFKKGTAKEKQTAINLMRQIDPANISIYENSFKGQ